MKKLLLILAIALTSCASKNPNVAKYEKQKEEREAHNKKHPDSLIVENWRNCIFCVRPGSNRHYDLWLKTRPYYELKAKKKAERKKYID